MLDTGLCWCPSFWYRMQCYGGIDSGAIVVPIRRYSHQNFYSGRDNERRHQEIRHQAVGLDAKKPRCLSHRGFGGSNAR